MSTELIYGIHAVSALLERTPERVIEVWALKGRDDDRLQPLLTELESETMELARLCRQHGVGFNPHTWSNGIGFGVNLQILLGSGFANEQPFEYPLSPPGWTVEARDVVLARPWRHEKGVLTPPSTPGLGFDIDRAALKRHGRCFFEASRTTRHWMPEALKD